MSIYIYAKVIKDEDRFIYVGEFSIQPFEKVDIIELKNEPDLVDFQIYQTKVLLKGTIHIVVAEDENYPEDWNILGITNIEIEEYSSDIEGNFVNDSDPENDDDFKTYSLGFSSFFNLPKNEIKESKIKKLKEEILSLEKLIKKIEKND